MQIFKAVSMLATFVIAIILISTTSAQITEELERLSAPVTIVETLVSTNKPTLVRSLGPDPDDIVRAKKYVYITAASYCFDKLRTWDCEYCLKAKAAGYEFVSEVDNAIMNTVAVITINHAAKEIVVGFRGTINLPNAIQDAALIMTPVTGFGLLGFNPLSRTNIRVHSGFLAATNSLYDELVKQLQTLITANPDHSLVIVGHSLGAAMASIFLHKIITRVDLPVDFPIPASFAFFGYGEPRVGNQDYADWWNSQNFPVVRIVHKRDVVPHVPLPPIIGVLPGYVHHGTELWITPEDKDVSCSKSVYEDPTCSNSEAPLYSVLDHLTYWDVDFANCALDQLLPFLLQLVVKLPI